MGRINFLIVFITLTFQSFFLCSCSEKKQVAETKEYPFDNGRAFSYITKMVAFGPRVPGTDAHALTLEWLTAKLRENTDSVTIQNFTGKINGIDFPMSNIIASFYPEKKNRLLFCAHWDSRFKADKDPDPNNNNLPVPGANDGASGVAVLLEIASCLKAFPPEYGVDIVFFDGEDSGDYGDESGWILGSRYFAKSMPPDYKPTKAVLLDMIGDSDLSIVQENNSVLSAPALWDYITGKCGELGIEISSQQYSMTDDHIPLIERGIPSVDIIDFDYNYWHTVSDTPDKCSEISIGKIGRLVISIIYEMK